MDDPRARGPELTQGDAAVANLAMFLVAQVMPSPREDEAVAHLGRALRTTAGRRSEVARLRAVAAELVARWPERSRRHAARHWALVMLDLQAALADFVWWRAAMALDAACPPDHSSRAEAAA
ncbi:MAG TPA: hypothetical protein PKD10_05290 [Paracoccaceae bacterium]|nr:hypothetical protein [Paracoccaceae bacterium]HMO70107.1 hypothetical protein [Paracoccaceae bacterium]